MCMNCGATGGACCPGAVCQTGGTCVGSVNGAGGMCEACGATGQRCCGGNQFNLGSCTDMGTRCQRDDQGATTCRACGAMGGPCCLTGTACTAGLSCQNGPANGANQCLPCGGMGQACCGTGNFGNRTCTTGLTCRFVQGAARCEMGGGNGGGGRADAGP
jgi:hypothetical protein